MLLKETCVPAQLNRPWGGFPTGHVASVFSDQAQKDGEIGTSCWSVLQEPGMDGRSEMALRRGCSVAEEREKSLTHRVTEVPHDPAGHLQTPA